MNLRWRTAFMLLLVLVGLIGAPRWAAAQWETPSRAFHKDTAFPLDGRHLTVPCASCHLKGVTKGTPTTCYDCHWVRRQDDVYRTRLGSSCEMCHRPTSWTATKWNHGAFTGLVLNAAHRTIGCESCHKNGQFSGASIVCATCHQKDYDQTRAPDHRAAGFPTSCEVCHRPSDTTFSGVRFDHASAFPLVGVHATEACASCHRNGVYRGTPQDCVGCHRTDFDRTSAPSHAAAGFSTACEGCHRPTDTTWRGRPFDHAAVFPLVGVHATETCVSCHRNSVYAGTPRDCVGCHRDDYDRTANPKHAAAGFSTACEGCHRPTDTSWVGKPFDHATVFPLVGVHATETCVACHRNNVFRGTPRDCVGCHRLEFDRTTSPNHAAAGFPTACETCHRPTDSSWRGSPFNHGAVFPLVGVHATQACATCHVNNLYRGTARDCVGCHRTLYERTTSPNHASAGFGTSCESCHRATDTSWRGAALNHNQFFPLVGRHATTTCTLCHVNSTFRGTPRECYPCHRPQYERTTSPNHLGAQFPTNCDVCHRAADTAWSQGRFNHTWFPITSGAHKNRACVECHTNPANYQSFTCLTCHERTETDRDHRNRSGYRYESPLCYACHPNGRSD